MQQGVTSLESVANELETQGASFVTVEKLKREVENYGDALEAYVEMEHRIATAPRRSVSSQIGAPPSKWRIAMFGILLALLATLAVVFMSITIAAFVDGNIDVAVGALGPGLAAVFGLTATQQRILVRWHRSSSRVWWN